jgi:PAS domain S-box-containing protein
MLNFQRLFESLPGLFIIYDLDFVIVGGSDAYFQSTLTKREEVVGRHLFEVFPDNPDDPNADGVRNLRASLESVLKYRKPHTMAVQKYDIRRPDSVGGGFEERYWTPVNFPLFDENGVMTHIIHRAEDVTEFVQVQQQRNEQRQLNRALQSRTDQMEMEIYARVQELKEVNEQLQVANEALSELDLAKTVFFSNVSHEFRTPLTLMLDPLDETLNRLNGQLPAAEREQLQMVQRNGQRLLKLVNTLLDFSRIEAGRMAVVYELTDLAAFTAELASVFRSAIAQANLSLVVDCPPLAKPTWVDREMWEKIVLNLLSNAFKFTLEGEIVVALRERNDQIELEVRDTGIGIPTDELSHIFERFYRVREAKGRTYEGTGIGLSLVQELVRLHGGTIKVSSVVNRGTSFTVSIPTGYAHLPQDRIGVTRTLTSTATGATTWVQEIQRWLPEAGNGEWVIRNGETPFSSPTCDSQLPTPRAARILLVDDNSDMRHYLRRLLSDRGYAVETAIDGKAALAAVEQQQPDLVLTDVMMPQLDGLGLLRELRANPTTRKIPIILLSARAGEEARIEGLKAGADDYLTKPFSARELLARVEATLKLAQLRREAEATLRESEEKYRTLFESIDEAFCLVEVLFDDAGQAVDNRFLETNPAFERITGLENAIGKTIGELVPDIESHWSETLGKVAKTRQPERWSNRSEAMGFWFDLYAFAVDEPETHRVAIIFSNITERKQAERRVEFLTELSRKLGTMTDAAQINRIVTREVGTFLNGHRCYYLDVTPDGSHVTVLPDWRLDGPDLAGTYDLALFGAKEWWETAARQPFGIDDVNAHPWTKDFPDNYTLINMQSYAIAPFVREGRWVASIGVSSDKPRHWTADELLLLENVVARVAPLIERARSEADLRRSEAKYRSLFESMDEGFCICEMLFDEEGKPQDYRFLEVNSAFEKITGFQQAVGKTALELVPDPEAHWIEICNTVVQMGEPVWYEHQSVAMNRWFNINVSRIDESQNHKFAVLVTDITDRKQAEAAIQSSNEQFKLLAESASNLLLVEDPKVYLASLFEKIATHLQLEVYFNYFFQEDEQRLELYTYGGISADVAAAARFLELGQAVCGYVVQQRRPAVIENALEAIGPLAVRLQSVGIRAYASHPLIVGERVIGTLGLGTRQRDRFTRDELDLMQAVTTQVAAALERSRLLTELQARAEALDRANRIKDEFLAVLSHELRSPLNPILGWSRLLQNGKLDETKTAQALATIERNAKLQSELIEDLLDVSRILQGKLSLTVAPVNLAFIIRAAMETVQLAAEAKSIKLEASLAEDVGPVWGDSTRLQQVIWNLLSNAVKFTLPGGQVNICLERLDSYAFITVSDTGRGIAPDFLPYVFDYFRQANATTTRKFGGLGLGLAIVRQLVELHGGTVRAESLGEGQGATFIVQIPLMPTLSKANQDERSALAFGNAKGERSSASLSQTSSLDLNGIKILLVDDDTDTREFVAFLLEQQGAQVSAATSAHEALLILPQEKPDVLLSDIGMPDMDGYMLIQQVRTFSPEQGGQIPAIALTAYAGDMNQQQALAAGFQKHISKPIEAEKLIQVISSLLTSTSP